MAINIIQLMFYALPLSLHFKNCSWKKVILLRIPPAQFLALFQGYLCLEHGRKMKQKNGLVEKEFSGSILEKKGKLKKKHVSHPERIFILAGKRMLTECRMQSSILGGRVSPQQPEKKACASALNYDLRVKLLYLEQDGLLYKFSNITKLFSV